MTKNKTISVSIVTPFFNESDCIVRYFKTIVPILEEITADWEIICVDDGSVDVTPDMLINYHNRDDRIRVIRLSRNFGKEAALTAGLDACSKDVAIPIDADLQDPPSLIPKLIAKHQEGYNVVNCVRSSRKDGIIRNCITYIYYKIFSYLTNNKIPENAGDFRLLDRKALAALKGLKEKSRYMKGLMSWVGFKTATVHYDRPRRKEGISKFGGFRLLRLAADGIVSFSTKPLKFWLYLGVLVSSLSFSYACYLIFRTLISGVDLPGYASIMVAILFMSGVQLIGLGVIGEYIARIFKEVKNRPIYIVDQEYEVKKGKPISETKTRKSQEVRSTKRSAN